MSEMVERVARAMYVARHERMGTLLDNFDDWPPEYRVSYYEDAKAAIAAMREPDTAMLGADVSLGLSLNQGWRAQKTLWQRMIDAALR